MAGRVGRGGGGGAKEVSGLGRAWGEAGDGPFEEERGGFVGVSAGNGFSGGVGTVVVLGVGRWLSGGRGRRV